MRGNFQTVTKLGEEVGKRKVFVFWKVYSILFQVDPPLVLKSPPVAI